MAAARSKSPRPVFIAVLALRDFMVWPCRAVLNASRRYSEAVVRRALEDDAASPRQTWVWGASGVR